MSLKRLNAVTSDWLLLVTLLLMWTNVPAQDRNDPRELIDKTIETLREQVIREQRRLQSEPRYAMVLVEGILSPHVDLKLASRLVLGTYWNVATVAQRDAFVDGLQRLMLRIIALHISDYRDAEVVYSPTLFKGAERRRAVVRTKVSRDGGAPVSVDYRLYRGAAGWKVYDVSIVGISLVKTYRITIEYDLKKYGIDGVIEQINAKVPLS